jgi:hypothetical protein
MNASEPDPYVVLGVSRGVSREELKRRYRELAKRWHPDRHSGDTAADRDEADRQMKLINAAYRSLFRLDSRQSEAHEHTERMAREHTERSARERTERRARTERERAERTEREHAERERAERTEREHAERERAERTEQEQAERERAERDARERSRFASVTLSDRTTFHPVGLVFPRGRVGYTVRIRVDEDDDDDVIFLARGRRLRLFRSPEAMADFLMADTEHDLTRLPNWRTIRRSIRKASLEPDVGDYFDFDFVLRALGRRPELWVPRAFVACRDIVFEIAKAFRNKSLLDLVAPGSAIDQLDDLMRIVDEPFAGWSARRKLQWLSGSTVKTHWGLAATRIRGISHWQG